MTGTRDGISNEEADKKRQAERQLRFLARDVLPVLTAVCSGFTEDPGTSELDDIQPVWVSMKLGDYRRAKRLKHEVEKAQ